MADNVTFQPVTATPIDGTVIATDDCAGAQVQIFKQAIATDGSATLIPATAADGLLVNLGTNNDVTAVVSGVVDVGEITGPVALPTGAATSANQSTANGLLTTIDGDTSALAGTVAGSELQVDVVTMPAVTATVSGTVAATQSGTWTVQPGNTANSTAWLVTGTGGTFPVTGTVAATQSGTWNITNVSGTVSLPTGASTLAEQQTQTTSLQLIDDTIATTGSAIPTKGCVASGTDGTNARVLKTDSSGELQVDVLTLPNVTLAAGTNTNEVVGDVAEDQPLAGNPVRQGVRASAAAPTAMSTDGDVVTPWADLRGRQVVTSKAATGTTSNVASSASNVTLLAANTSRLGAIFYNDSTQTCYVKLAATATSASFSYLMAAASTLEIPFGYAGIIDGIWASANGNMRVTELT